ncbi:MAG: choice-of-anchor L domain-containing protein, partial [Flavobacteriales bacterium]|nr:choice-of-anchor L domain-containing protein [Flavobacteriales bacterium]
MMKRIITATLFSIACMASWGQIEVSQDYTIEQYVNDILLGTGVEAVNITYQGSEIQIGYLTGAEGTNFPISQGLILSSEHARNSEIAFPDEFIPFGEGVSGDADLLTIANSVPPLIGQNFNVGSVNDLCILEFDFIATGDTVSFNYSFGSDEYLEWVNSSYNDIFGFFLSGPGIVGPYGSPAGFPDGSVNIAGVPLADPPLPITISSVNDVLNSAYYIDNVGNADIALDGYTTKLVASHPVICGEMYHIKLAVGDGSDTALESVVVLEAGSFSSNAVVQIDLSIDVGGPEANTLYEDCGQAVLTFTRPEVSILEIEEMVIITYEGDAINGIDYTLLPDTVLFESGVESVSFDVSAIVDGIAEGPELVHFNILNLAACNGAGAVSTFDFYISDFPDPLVVEGYDTDLCVGDVLTLEPIITGGYGNFVYDWSTAETTATIDVSPALTTEYFLTVSDTCGMPSDDASFLITVLDVPNLEVTLDPSEIQAGCAGVQVTATATGGIEPYEFYWYNEDDANLWGFGNTLWVSTWTGADEVNVEVTDQCGFTSVATAPVTYDIPDLEVDFPETMEFLCNENFTLSPDIISGGGGYWYNWYVNGGWVDWQPTYTTSSSQDLTVTVEIGDACGNFGSFTTNIEILS